MFNNYLRKSFIERAVITPSNLLSASFISLSEMVNGAKGVQRYLLLAPLVTYLNNLHLRHLYF